MLRAPNDRYWAHCRCPWRAADLLPGAKMTGMIDPTWKGVVFDRTGATFEPSQKARPNIRGQFELNRPASFLLDDNRSGSDLGAGHQVADLDFDQVAAQLTVDCEVKQSSIAKPSFAFEEEANCPYLLLR
jgi:hypothetical protein